MFAESGTFLCIFLVSFDGLTGRSRAVTFYGAPHHRLRPHIKRHGSDFDTIPVIKVCENIQSGWIHLHIHKPSFSVSDDIVVRQMYTACQKVLPRLKVPSEMWVEQILSWWRSTINRNTVRSAETIGTFRTRMKAHLFPVNVRCRALSLLATCFKRCMLLTSRYIPLCRCLWSTACLFVCRFLRRTRYAGEHLHNNPRPDHLPDAYQRHTWVSATSTSTSRDNGRCATEVAASVKSRRSTLVYIITGGGERRTGHCRVDEDRIVSSPDMSTRGGALWNHVELRQHGRSQTGVPGSWNPQSTDHFLCFRPPDSVTKVLCFRDVPLSRSFVCPFIRPFVVHHFVWTDIVTTISHERLEQCWWNLQGITIIP